MSKKKNDPNARDLYDFLRSPAHYFEVFHLYLDPSKPITINKVEKIYVRFIEAAGTGWDGELQRVHFNPDNKAEVSIKRYWERSGTQLPVQSGKIYSMLLSMGYSFWSDRLEMAERYNHYTQTGISNLGKNDHLEALIEKQERQLQRRKEYEESQLN